MFRRAQQLALGTVTALDIDFWGVVVAQSDKWFEIRSGRQIIANQAGALKLFLAQSRRRTASYPRLLIAVALYGSVD